MVTGEDPGLTARGLMRSAFLTGDSDTVGMLVGLPISGSVVYVNVIFEGLEENSV